MLVASVLSACGKWPPYGEDLTDYVRDRKTYIEELVSQFEGSEFARIDCQPCFAEDSAAEWASVSYAIVDGGWRKVDNPRSADFAKMFRDAGIMSVSKRSSGETELGIAVPSNHKNRRYFVQLFHEPNHRTNTVKECVAEFEDIDCGWCKVSIDENFWIRYQWYPDDMDQELTRAGANGEISWDEWQARNRAAEDACMKAGLQEQGYELDTN
jgi:hypothetical protein